MFNDKIVPRLKEINNPFGQVPWNLKALLRFKVQEEKVILRSIRSRFSVVEKEATKIKAAAATYPE